LLYQIHESIPDLPRLRFVTSFPRDFTDEALMAMRDCPRICRYLHAPAQHGSDRILKLMNRGYTAGRYREFLARAREMMPDVCVASDFIVGFPTETDDDFTATIELLRECRFKNSFIFKYSPRPGTAAIERFADDVPGETKRRRNSELLCAQQQISAELNRQCIGRRVEVLVEGQSKLVSRRESRYGGSVELAWEKRTAPCASGHTQWVGRTRGDQVVVFDGDASMKGKILDLEIIDAQSLTLFGRSVRETALATTL
jgi:tRNA-2-methylthio-N6-dimethylallyladenosine synthase